MIITALAGNRRAGQNPAYALLSGLLLTETPSEEFSAEGVSVCF